MAAEESEVAPPQRIPMKSRCLCGAIQEPPPHPLTSDSIQSGQWWLVCCLKDEKFGGSLGEPGEPWVACQVFCVKLRQGQCGRCTETQSSTPKPET